LQLLGSGTGGPESPTNDLESFPYTQGEGKEHAMQDDSLGRENVNALSYRVSFGKQPVKGTARKGEGNGGTQRLRLCEQDRPGGLDDKKGEM